LYTITKRSLSRALGFKKGTAYFLIASQLLFIYSLFFCKHNYSQRCRRSIVSYQWIFHNLRISFEPIRLSTFQLLVCFPFHVGSVSPRKNGQGAYSWSVCHINLCFAMSGYFSNRPRWSLTKLFCFSQHCHHNQIPVTTNNVSSATAYEE
jgi:hypothetical protein